MSFKKALRRLQIAQVFSAEWALLGSDYDFLAAVGAFVKVELFHFALLDKTLEKGPTCWFLSCR